VAILVSARFVGSDGVSKARKVGDNEDFGRSLLNVGSLWAVGFVGSFLVRGSSGGVSPTAVLRGATDGRVVRFGVLRNNRH
jgi:hypothetical protein